MNRTIHVQSGHTLWISTVEREHLPAHLRDTAEYETFYQVRNWDKDGVCFMYLGKGYHGARNAKDHKEVVVWYRNGGFWSGCGSTLKSAIEGAQKDGWMYA